jgi:hypothetical protein
MQYNSLISCIPKDWLLKLRQCTGEFYRLPESSIKVQSTFKQLQSITCKEFYNEFVRRKVTIPTAIRKWEDEYFYANFQWNIIFRLPYTSSRETTVQSQQFQIINRYFPCRQMLHTWYEHEDPHCIFCDNEIDSIEHYFFFCNTVRDLWRSFSDLFRATYNVYFQLGCLDIMFGLYNELNDNILTVMNFCILQGKAYIKKAKANNVPITLQHFVNFL